MLSSSSAACEAMVRVVVRIIWYYKYFVAQIYRREDCCLRIAIYLRISSEDGDLKDTGKAESESISNQRGLLLNFISNHSEFSGWEVSEFCDDGWSGKNFERPDFLRMMEQIKQGQIDCVLVKDLSRFGRDYLVVGNYISLYHFPFPT